MQRAMLGGGFSARCRPISKYLLPLEPPWHWLPTCRAPSAWIGLAELAEAFPRDVDLRQLSDGEARRSLTTPCFTGGQRTDRIYRADCVDAETIAVVRNGRSFGRQGAVLSPGGEWAVRESGYFHSWEWLRGRRRSLASRISPIAWRRRWETDVTRRRRLPRVRRLDASVAVLNLRCSGNYYHWLADVVARVALVQRAGIRPDYYLVDCFTPAHRELLTFVGIDESQLIQPHFGLTLEARELILPSLPQRLGQLGLRDLLLTALRPTDDAGVLPFPRRIYISRRNAGTRRLKNEGAVSAMLEARGFEVHCLEDYSFARQAEVFQTARTIVATHGAGLANLLMARSDASVVEIIYPGRYNNDLFPRLSQRVGLQHVQVEAPRSARKQILNPALDDIAAAIDFVESSREREGQQTRQRRAA